MMPNAPVSLGELLSRREDRAARQRELLRRCEGASLISFTVNYPGPVKLCEDSRLIHREGARAIGRQLLYETVPHFELEEHPTGPEGFWLVEKHPLELKGITCELEETHLLGRLFDIDVLGADGVLVSRRELGLPARKCLLCDGEPALCRREGRHSLEELIALIHEMVERYRNDHPN